MSDTVVNESVPYRVLGTRIRRVRDGFLIGVQNEAIFLEGPASLIFESIDARLSIADVAARVAETYSITRDEATEDVRTFVADLSDRGIIGLLGEDQA